MKGFKKRVGLYTIAGAYLLYLAWQLIRDFSTTEANKVIIVLAIILFIAAGGTLLGFGIYYSFKEAKEKKRIREEEMKNLPTLTEKANFDAEDPGEETIETEEVPATEETQNSEENNVK